MSPQIPVDRQRIAEFCRRHRIRKLSLFGSVLREDFRPDSDVDVLVEFEPEVTAGPDSDVDVLVEFEPEVTAGLIRVAGMELELSQLLKRKADLRTPAELSRYFRHEVLAHAQVQ